MKFNFQGFAYLAFAALIGFTSCKKDEEVPAPTLTFNLDGAQSGSFNAGETVNFDMNLTSDNDYTSLKGTLVYTKNDNSSVTVTLKDANNANKDMNYTKNSDIEDAYDGTNVVKVALPADAKRGSEWTITVEASTSGGKTTAVFKGRSVLSWTTILLGARSNNAGSFFAPSTGAVIGASNAVANVGIIDITYAWDETVNPQAPVLASYFARTALGFLNVPANAKKTQFVATNLTATEFLSESTSWNSYFSGLSFGSDEKVAISATKVYAFKNAEGKKGLIHVDEVINGTEGSTTIRVKYEN